MIVNPLSSTVIPPVAAPDLRCAWCWYVAHPGKAYPAAQSSSACRAHAQWLRQQRTKQRKGGAHHVC
ncbi:hypothetical protein [Thermosporothrix hazakensis]|jgi:hypothetical protein|uniref:hypothetical protein n=1 Tax=Thermosporothrix hazakensis TaxID=644383 RepID=UPI000DAE67CC|nr:hypothetical protein [Thermosporothrix hazakensis]GCE49258.1 hypothetical protein KTH_41270 [Thermosporothrix hazakensis]